MHAEEQLAEEMKPRSETKFLRRGSINEYFSRRLMVVVLLHLLIAISAHYIQCSNAGYHQNNEIPFGMRVCT